MQAPQQEGAPLTGAKWSYATFDFDWSCTTGSRCHEFLARSEIKRELFIMLAREKGSQLRQISDHDRPIPKTFETPRRDGCIPTCLPRSVPRTSSQSAGSRTMDRSQIHSCLEANR